MEGAEAGEGEGSGPDSEEEVAVEFHEDEEIIEVLELNEVEADPDDVASDVVDVDFAEEPEDGEMGDEDSETDDDSDTEDESMEEAEPEDDSELTYDDHLGPVYCVNLDPKENNLAVTGGEFSRAYVWRLSDGETLFECKGHDGPIGFAEFSYDSAMVLTGDMNGLIKAWKVEDGKEVWSYEVPDLEVGAPKDEYEEQNVPYVLLLESRKQKLQWLEWHPRSHVLLYGTPDGNTWMWNIPSGECKTFQGPKCPATCGQFLPDGERAVVGYEDGSVWIWDLKQGNTVHVLKGSDGHKGPLSCLSSNSDGSLILTGGFDCDTKMINTATGKVVAVFRTERDVVKASKYDVKFNSVESVGFCTVLPLVAVLYLDGSMAVFDISTQHERARCQHKSSIRRVLWDHYSPVLYTCCSDGVLRLWDSRSGEIISEYCGHTADIVDFALNKDSSIVVTASTDREAKVFCVQRIDR